MIKPLDPSLARSSNEEQMLKEAQRKAELEVNNLNSSALADKKKKLREAAEGFESIFIQQMWQSMRASLPKEGLMHSREEQFWQGMYDQELSKSMASAGGIGLADMMTEQLSKNLKNASDVAAETIQRKPLPIAPVPLIETQHTPIPVQKSASTPIQTESSENNGIPIPSTAYSIRNTPETLPYKKLQEKSPLPPNMVPASPTAPYLKATKEQLPIDAQTSFVGPQQQPQIQQAPTPPQTTSFVGPQQPQTQQAVPTQTTQNNNSSKT